jgi:iron-sulfur cluster repair protein YtfE (RIC family)
MGKAASMFSKVVDTAKQARAAFYGEPGIFSRLEREHGKVAALLMRAASTSDPATRRELYPRIRRELMTHLRGEEQELYPVLEQYAETRVQAGMAREEHREVERTLDQLSAIDPSSDSWPLVAEQLRVALERHVRDEEDELFPKARRIIGWGRARTMEDRYVEAKARAGERLG